MAAVQDAALTNGYDESQINGHSYNEEDSILEESSPKRETHKAILKTAPSFEEKTVKISNPEVTSPSKFSGDEEISIFENGPDQVLPTDKSWTINPNGSVQLRISENDDITSHPPLSVPGLLHKSATKFPNHIALSFKGPDGVWSNVTFREYEENVRTVAKAFIHLGLQKYRGVCIIGFNSPEWFYADIGAIYAGGFAVGIYTTNSPEACFHCLDISEANICVVEDDKQLQKILEIRNTLPNLKAIIQYTGTPTSPDVMSWSDLMKLGKNQSDVHLEEALKKIAINQCCTLVFTSGTEGKPKAVMLSHDSLTWDAVAASKHIDLSEGVESIVSYLPLSHIAAQLADIYIPMAMGAKTVFGDKDALKGSLVKTLVEVRPTVFLGVPRVYEKIKERMMSIGAQTTGLKKMIATWGKASCLQHYMSAIDEDCSDSYLYKFYRWLIFSKVKAALGLDKCKICISAAAPLAPEVKRYFMSLDILITDAFGMSETSGAHSMSTTADFQMDSLGKPIGGTETKLDNPTADGDGEICMRGRHVFMGYLRDLEKTKKSLDSEGWLHSGDVGKLDSKGHLHITGRIKEILITAGGENIPPVLIEQVLKKELTCISNAQLIGDKRKFLSILLTLKTEVDPDSGAPLEELTTEVKAWCRSLGCQFNTITEILKGSNKPIMDAIQAGIDRTNKQAISHAQWIQKFAILPQDFSITGGELGPTLKLKRDAVYEKYADIIDNFYKQ